MAPILRELVCAAALFAVARAAAAAPEFAPEKVVSLDVWVEDDAAAETPELTARRVENWFQSATNVLQGSIHATDPVCPVRLGPRHVAIVPVFPNTPGCDPFTRGHAGVTFVQGGCFTASSANGTPGTIALLGAALHPPYVTSGWLLAHEVGHMAAGLGDFANGPKSLMGGDVGPDYLYQRLAPSECAHYVSAAFPGGRAQCLLVDADRTAAGLDPLYPAPAWTTCRDGTGFCDGTGICTETDTRCFTPEGPVSPGTDCSVAGVCRVCSGREANCIPCAARAPNPPIVDYFATRQTFPRMYVSRRLPGAAGDSLVELDATTGVIYREIPLPGEVPALAFDPRLQRFHAVVRQGASAALFAVDLRGSATLEAALDRPDLRGLDLSPETGSLFGVDGSSGEIVRIDPTSGVSALVTPTGLVDVEGLAAENDSDFQVVGRTPSDPAGGSRDADEPPARAEVCRVPARLQRRGLQLTG